ncbi:hypothetical protein JCM10908_001343 [Rhodotorula pacifica]|uniref:uncharacterized protein n=1 Tax=Rhodotorula pacifica TaxID=1495444 RepID=UPI00317F90CA
MKRRPWLPSLCYSLVIDLSPKSFEQHTGFVEDLLRRMPRLRELELSNMDAALFEKLVPMQSFDLSFPALEALRLTCTSTSRQDPYHPSWWVEVSKLSAIRKELGRRVQDRTAALLESERQYKELADQYGTLPQVSPVGIFQTEPQGRFAFANPRFYEISGQLDTSPREGWRQNVRSEYVEKVEQIWDDAMSRWQPDRDVVTTEFPLKNGKWVQLGLRAFEKGYMGSITDISHQQEVEALQLREVETRAPNAEETCRSTDAFLDTASHELRNPLSGMWQNAEIVSASLKSLSKWLDRYIKQGMFDSSVVNEMRQELIENIEGVESIRVCADHQKWIADDIINVSKLNMGLLAIELAPFNFEDVLREVVKSFEATARDRHIALSLTQNASLDRLGIGVVVADAGRIRQLAYNFISNALKYGVRPSGGVVTVILDANDAALPPLPTSRRIADPDLSFSPPVGYVWCSVSVENSGRGLSAEQLEKRFARFSQGQSPLTNLAAFLFHRGQTSRPRHSATQ